MQLARVKVFFCFSSSSFATGNWISRADKSPDARVGAMVSAERLTLASVYLVTAAGLIKNKFVFSISSGLNQ